MRLLENIFYTEQQLPRQVLDVYLPDADTFPVFVYFHGGGITAGDKKRVKFIPWLQERGIAVVSANYRLYPNAKYPEFIQDAAAAVAWVRNNMAQFGHITGVFVGGSSAGAYLSQMLCFDASYLAACGVDADAVDGYFFDAGQPTTHFNVLKERGMDGRRVIIDEAAPIYHIAGDRDYPPMRILVSDGDMENRPEQTALLVSTLKHFKVPENKIIYSIVPDSKHCGYVGKFDDAGDSVFGKMVKEFIDEVQHRSFN